MERMSENIFTRIEPTVKDAAERAGLMDDRTTSYIVRIALIEYLKKRGLLPANFGIHQIDDSASVTKGGKGKK